MNFAARFPAKDMIMLLLCCLIQIKSRWVTFCSIMCSRTVTVEPSHTRDSAANHNSQPSSSFFWKGWRKICIFQVPALQPGLHLQLRHTLQVRNKSSVWFATELLHEIPTMPVNLAPLKPTWTRTINGPEPAGKFLSFGQTILAMNRSRSFSERPLRCAKGIDCGASEPLETRVRIQFPARTAELGQRWDELSTGGCRFQGSGVVEIFVRFKKITNKLTSNWFLS